MGQFVCYAKQYIFYRIFFGLFCCNINFGICRFIRIAIIKNSIIFVTICLIDKMSFVIKPYFYPNGKIIIGSDKFYELHYFGSGIFIKFLRKYTSDASLFCRVNIFIFELFLYPKYQNTHLGKLNAFIFLYRQFRICFTNASGKAHTPKDARACPKAPSGRELPTKSGEGERVIIKFNLNSE